MFYCLCIILCIVLNSFFFKIETTVHYKQHEYTQTL